MDTFDKDHKEAGGIDAMVADLMFYRDDIKDLEPDPGDDDACGEVRLQYHDGLFYLRTGDPQYDQDGRGFWGCGMVGANMTDDELRDVAIALVDDCADHYAECQA